MRTFSYVFAIANKSMWTSIIASICFHFTGSGADGDNDGSPHQLDAIAKTYVLDDVPAAACLDTPLLVFLPKASHDKSVSD